MKYVEGRSGREDSKTNIDQRKIKLEEGEEENGLILNLKRNSVRGRGKKKTKFQ